jgi:hypothetical protein
MFYRILHEIITLNWKKSVQKCNRPVSEYIILIEHMIGDLKKITRHSELCGDIRGGRN